MSIFFVPLPTLEGSFASFILLNTEGIDCIPPESTMNIVIKKIADELNVQIPDLITRHVGKNMYYEFKEIIRDIVDGEVAVLDFSNIRVIDPSFIDEFLVKLIIDSRESSSIFYIKLSNISDIAEINIDSVFNSYYSFKKMKMVVSTDRLMTNNSFYIGNLTEVERDIIGYLNINRIAASDEIADFLGRDEESASKILNELHAIRIIRKEKTGNKVSYLSV